jgi:hypothetical protein
MPAINVPTPPKLQKAGSIGRLQLTSCYEFEDAAMLFGIMPDAGITDVSNLRPLMAALVAAAD